MSGVGTMRFAALSVAFGCMLATTAPARGQTVVRNIDVHVESEHPVELLGHSESNARWASMCRSPCDVPVPLTWTYEVRAEDASTSTTFHLRATEDDAKVAVRPASPFRIGLGSVLTAFGVLGGVVGAILTHVGSLEQGCPGVVSTTGTFPGAGCNPYPNRDLQLVGPIVVGAGIAAVVGGILLIVDGSTMRASQVE